VSHRVSVLIRNRNEAACLRLVLPRLREQVTQPAEIVVVDNESTDESRQVAEQHQCKIVHLPAGEFTYGRATNLGFENCASPLVMLLSSHSLPLGTHFICDAIRPFEDPKVAAVRIPIAVNTAELEKVAQMRPLDGSSEAREVFARGPVASGSVIRRAVWERFRQDEKLGAAEDKEWALRVLRSGEGWVMPVANTAYAYVRRLDGPALLRKYQKEERAGLEAAGIHTPPHLGNLLKTSAALPRNAMAKVIFEWKMFLFRRGLAAEARRRD
jgi:GT2 family glycosyltransferase